MVAERQSQTRDESTKVGAYSLTADGVLRLTSKDVARLPRRLAAVLSELLAANGAAVSHIELLERCWGNKTINDENLYRAISDLRKIFRDGGHDDPIEAVYGRGYRLNLPHSEGNRGAAAHRAAAFCREAWHRLYQRRLNSIESAEYLFDRAATEDPDDVQAWLGIAEIQFHRMQAAYAAAIEAWPRARVALQRALTLDPTCADALALFGLGLTWAEYDFAEGRRLLERALKHEPNSHLPNEASALHHLSLGRFEDALKYFRRAVMINPASMTARGLQAITLMFSGESKDSLLVARQLLQLDPGGAVSQGLASMIEAALGRAETAINSAQYAFEQLPESPVAGSILAYAMARGQRQGEARALLESLAKSHAEVGLSAMACPAWLELGDSERALVALEAAAARRCPWLPMILHDPRIDFLRADPLFKAIFKDLFGQVT